MLTLTHILQGLRYFTTSLAQKINGPRKYFGTATKICQQIVDACWNGRYFQTSTHHYREFWARDFGYCAKHLVSLGYREKVLSTLDYALSRYQKTGIKTTISRGGWPFSFPNIYAPDSVALIFHALRVSNATKLVRKYHLFLQRELDLFAATVLEEGRVKRGAHFGGMRDYARHDSSCYNHCMSILLAREAHALGLDFAYTEHELVETLDEYWMGNAYRDDRRITQASGDANTLPYWLGVGKQFSHSHATLRKNGLDTPLPLAYAHHKETHMIPTEFFVPNWQHHTIWPFLGLLYCHAAKQYDPALAKHYKQAYAAHIETYRTLYEVLNPDGTPYTSAFYHADEGLLWAAMYLTL